MALDSDLKRRSAHDIPKPPTGKSANEFLQDLRNGGLTVRGNQVRFSLPVEPRSAYLLSGEARYEWEHRIVPGDELRFSITFRTMSDLGRRKAAELQRSS